MNDPPMLQPKPKGRGCFFYGCLTVIILLLVMVVGGYFTFRAVVKSLVATYTDSAPMALPKTELSEAEMDALDQRLAAFRKGVQTSNAVPVLVLEANEINALIHRDPGLRDKLHVSFEDDQVKGSISLPLGELQAPMIGRWLKGRYLNGSAALKASMQNGLLVVTLQSVEVNGRPIPANMLAGLQAQNLAQGFCSDPKKADVMGRLESFEIKGGKVTIKPKTKE